MDETLFGRISRHGVSIARDPREDRLTEVCAAVWCASPCAGLALHVARGWLTSAAAADPTARLTRLRDLLDDESAPWECRIKTQGMVWTRGGTRRPDLELAFHQLGTDENRRLVLLVEVKHGSKPDREQLHAYVQALEQRTQHGAVILVAPRSSYPFDPAQIPGAVLQMTWEDSARRVATFDTADPVGAFLADELGTYLREEGLMDPDAITPEHFAALAHYQEARRALTRACELAAKRVDALWAPGEPADSWRSRGDIRQTWWLYPSEADDDRSVDAGEWRLGWNLFVDGAELLLDGRPGVPLFTVGVAAAPGAVADLDPEVRERLEATGFYVLPLGTTRSRRNEYVIRAEHADELLAGGRDLDSSAQTIAEWVHAAFRDLADTFEARSRASLLERHRRMRERIERAAFEREQRDAE